MRDDEKFKMRLRALANVFTKTDRILTGDRKITVTLLDGAAKEALQFPPESKIPGLSQYPNIYLNPSAFEEIQNTSTLVGLLGLNYHELSHLMFTPRGWKKWLSNHHRELVMSYEILEDQRIESFFTALYEPAGKFFTEMFVKFVMDDEQYWPILFLYSYGRGYLPMEMREEFESRFVRQDLIKRIKRCIDDYKALTSFERANNVTGSEVLRVLNRFKNILQELRKEGQQPPRNNCDSNDQETGSTDEEATNEARDKDKKRRQRENRTGQDQSNFWDDEEEDEEDEEDASDGGSGDSEGDESDDTDGGVDDSEDGSDEDIPDDDSEQSDGGRMDDGENSDESDGDGDGDDSGDDDGDSGDDSAEEDSDSSLPGDGSSASGGEEGEPADEDGEGSEEDSELDSDADGGGQSGSSSEVSTFSDEELREYMEEVSEAIEFDDSVQEEITRVRSAMIDDANLDVIDFGKVGNVMKPITEKGKVATRDVIKDFRRLWAEVDPGWKYGSDIGKLNVGRAMMDLENYDEMFDEWDEGREQEVGLEVFMSLDISGSMAGSEIQLASEAMWILKRSLDEVEAKTTVVGFHEHTFGLFDRNTKANPSQWPLWTDLGGATNPALSLKLGRTVLGTSQMPNKLFVIITDGGWSGGWDEELPEGKDYIDLIDEIPGTRMYVGVGPAGGMYNKEEQTHFNVSKTINNPLEIVPLVKGAVEQMIKRRIR